MKKPYEVTGAGFIFLNVDGNFDVILNPNFEVQCFEMVSVKKPGSDTEVTGPNRTRRKAVEAALLLYWKYQTWLVSQAKGVLHEHDH